MPKIGKSKIIRTGTFLLTMGSPYGLGADTQDYIEVNPDVKEVVEWVKGNPDKTYNMPITDNIVTNERIGTIQVYERKATLDGTTFVLQYHDNNSDPEMSSDGKIGLEDELKITFGICTWRDVGLNGFMAGEEGDLATGVPGIKLRKNKPNQWDYGEKRKVHQHYMNSIIKPLKTYIQRTTHK